MHRRNQSSISTRNRKLPIPSAIHRSTILNVILCTPTLTEKHYAEKFSEEDHYRLNGVLTALKERFILSYNDDDDFIRELYKDFNIQPISRGNNLLSGQFKEVIIKNY